MVTRKIDWENPIKFGTDGWRAIIAEDFTFDNVSLIAAAIARYVKKSAPKTKQKLAIGYDRRFLSPEFAQRVAEVLAAAGVKTFLLDDYAGTPALSFAVKDKRCCGGVMITASHNPSQYNGVKFKGSFGGPAPESMTQLIEAEMHKITTSPAKIKRMDLDEAIAKKLVTLIDGKTPYIKAVKKLVNLSVIKKARFTVVYDGLHGAGIGYLDDLMEKIGVNVIRVRCTHNPSFGGASPEPIAKNLKPLIAAMKEHKADLGIANDGDADRVGIVDEKGNFITTQCVFALLVMHLVEDLKQTGKVVKAASTTTMLDRLAKLYGLPPVIQTKVGFKDVAEYMVKGGVLVGGEESGGYGIKGHIPERDGTLVPLLLLQMMAMRKKKMTAIVDELFSKVGKCAFNRKDQKTTPARQKKALAKLSKYAGPNPPKEFLGRKIHKIDLIDGYKFYFNPHHWLLIRSSGTEPLLRFYSEDTSIGKVNRILDEAVAYLLG